MFAPIFNICCLGRAAQCFWSAAHLNENTKCRQLLNGFRHESWRQRKKLTLTANTVNFAVFVRFRNSLQKKYKLKLVVFLKYRKTGQLVNSCHLSLSSKSLAPESNFTQDFRISCGEFCYRCFLVFAPSLGRALYCKLITGI